jgi:hypothetical protein
MLALERSRTVPGVVRLGLAVIVFGIVADLVTHLSFADADAAVGHTPAQLSAHAIVFAGMVLVIVGVIGDGIRQSAARRQLPGNHPPTGDT